MSKNTRGTKMKTQSPEDVKPITRRLKFWMQLVGASAKFSDVVAVNAALLDIGKRLNTAEINGPRWIEAKDNSIHYPEYFDLYVWDERPSINWSFALSQLASKLIGEEYLKFEIMQRFGWSNTTCFAVIVGSGMVSLKSTTEDAWQKLDFIYQPEVNAHSEKLKVKDVVIESDDFLDNE